MRGQIWPLCTIQLCGQYSIILQADKENKMLVHFYDQYLGSASFGNIIALMSYYCASPASRILCWLWTVWEVGEQKQWPSTNSPERLTSFLGRPSLSLTWELLPVTRQMGWCHSHSSKEGGEQPLPSTGMRGEALVLAQPQCPCLPFQMENQHRASHLSFLLPHRGTFYIIQSLVPKSKALHCHLPCETLLMQCLPYF